MIIRVKCLPLVWMFATTFLGSSYYTSAENPITVEKPKTSIEFGPCIWVIDRKCPDDDVKFYIYTRRNPHDRQLIHIDETWETSNLSSSYFDVNHPVKIIIHGYNADMFIHPLVQMKDEYLQRGEYNLIYIEWSTLSLGPCYVSAVHNTRHVGKCIAQLMERVLDAGTANMHLVGFSLGAQVTNFVAQNLKSFVIPRITGLDPAMPLFVTASLEDKLDSTDAAFVDVFHTNAFVQGKIERCGHVDFYMNGGIIQPGCFGQHENVLACSHHRAPDYFAESIRSYVGFWGWACSSYINYLLGLCPPTNLLALAGEHCDPDTRGMYLVTTRDAPPFALGKWTDISSDPPEFPISLPFLRNSLNADQTNQWGKIQGTFNNIQNFPMENWSYFDRVENGDVVDLVTDNPNRGNDAYNSMRKKTVNRTRNRTKVSEASSSTTPKINTKNQSRRDFIEEYKRNLTYGVIEPSVFQLPSLSSN